MSGVFDIRQVLQRHRLFGFLHQRLRASARSQPAILDRLLDYIDAYCTFNRLPADQVISRYEAFLEQYNRDVKNFHKHGAYPVKLHSQVPQIARRDYDLALMLSTVLASHRYRIMQLLHEKTGTGKRGLVVGCGSGLELALIQPSFPHLIAYDSSIDPFVRKQHPRVLLREDEFRSGGGETYEKIFLIEILEHLEDPYALLAHCSSALRNGGEILLTTATNIPQFDHLYNFEADHSDFETKAFATGLDVSFKEEIKHEYITVDIGAKNVFYVLSRRP